MRGGFNVVDVQYHHDHCDQSAAAQSHKLQAVKLNLSDRVSLH